jgi:hypothetical protein
MSRLPLAFSVQKTPRASQSLLGTPKADFAPIPVYRQELISLFRRNRNPFGKTPKENPALG